MSEAKTVIGLEVHIQLDTRTKLFCSCGTAGGGAPNSQTCAVCLGMPGSRPRVNKKALDHALRLALALQCSVQPRFFFSRKTYFYPDLAKNFQITQYEIPVGINGQVRLNSGKNIRIERIHLEEDPAALIHPQGMGSSYYSLVDYNRSGIPLVEIVTAPDFDSPQEAREFLNKMESILHYLDVHQFGDQGIKVDSNISLKGGERVEIKNITGFRNVEKGLSFEILRQRNLVRMNQKVVRETRAFDEKRGDTVSLRSKESEADYGYIFEPDLPRIEVDDAWRKEIISSLPELPEARAVRLANAFSLPEGDAHVICADKALAELFEEVLGNATDRKQEAGMVSRFFVRELRGILNHDHLRLEDTPISAGPVRELLEMLQKQHITEKSAKEAMIEYVQSGKEPGEYVREQDLLKEPGNQEMGAWVEEVLTQHPQAVTDFQGGNAKSLHFLVGQVLRRAKGKAEPREVEEALSKRLGKHG